ncbi:MAG: saccharopine dehydrogenase C-terminal domain-containing protein [Serpentinimonas sp.]|nr:saccharopine dehydrogenase C-terminal domain-containing protein [Serpentinimonas sp.]
MHPNQKLANFPGRLLMIGCGSVGQGVLPLILRHIEMDPARISIVTADARGQSEAQQYGVSFHILPLTQANFESILAPRLSAGDLLLNVSVDVSSAALLDWCCRHGVRYIDTCIEPWAGFYTDATLSAAQRSNYALREHARALKEKFPRAPSCVLAHGANPGLVSHFVKQALLHIARDTGQAVDVPSSQPEWAQLAHALGVKVIHIAERDTQVAAAPKRPGEFVNTWSIDGFASEGQQPAELGWGTHERHFPADAQRHGYGHDSAIYLTRPGAATRVRTWTPLTGPQHGFLITHNESISIADYFTLRAGDQILYRPTCHYAYHPCDAALLSLHELAGRNWCMQERQRLILDEVVSGIDELGVLLMGHAKGAYWYGSQLGIEQARRLAPHNNATSLQVVAGVLAALVWVLEHPWEGVVEADEIDFQRALQVASPYLGDIVGVYSAWSPLEGRGALFAQDVDSADPWQFKNFRVL